jgi:hypothetical protein
MEEESYHASEEVRAVLALVNDISAAAYELKSKPIGYIKKAESLLSRDLRHASKEAPALDDDDEATDGIRAEILVLEAKIRYLFLSDKEGNAGIDEMKEAAKKIDAALSLIDDETYYLIAGNIHGDLGHWRTAQALFTRAAESDNEQLSREGKKSLLQLQEMEADSRGAQSPRHNGMTTGSKVWAFLDGFFERVRQEQSGRRASPTLGLGCLGICFILFFAGVFFPRSGLSTIGLLGAFWGIYMIVAGLFTRRR